MFKLVFVCIVGITSFVADSSANKSIQAGDAFGIPVTRDVNDPEVLKMAAESLQKFELTSNNTNRLKIVKINSASTQVVSGYLTKISYDVALTNCTKGDTAADLQSCKVLENSPRQRCQTEIWNRPWLNDGKRINLICNNVNDATNAMNTFDKSFIWGPLMKHPEQFNDALKESLQMLEQVSQSLYKQQVIKVTSVTTQVVSGILTKIDFDVAFTKCLRNKLTGSVVDENCELLKDWPVRHCHSEIWNRPWLMNGKQITVTCNEDSIKNTRRGSCGLLGGACDVDVSTLHVQLAQESLQQLEQLTSSEYKQKVLNITTVTRQIASGTITKIYFHAAYTQCLRIEPRKNVASECEVSTDKPTRICHSEIWERPWLRKDAKIITVNCYDDSVTPDNGRLHAASGKDFPGYKINDSFGLIGGPTIQNPQQFNAAVNESLQKLEQISQSQYKQRVVKVTSVTTRVVNGFLTKIDFDVAFTKCLRNQLTTGVESCELFKHRPVRQCHSEIRNRPWLKKDGKQITVTCNDLSTNSIKGDTCGLSGGWCHVNVSTHHLQLAQESLQKLEQSNGSKYKEKVLKITSVMSLNASGTVTNMYFHAAYTKCLRIEPRKNVVSECEVSTDKPTRICHSEIWGTKIITVDCYDSASDTEFVGYNMNDSYQTRRKLTSVDQFAAVDPAAPAVKDLVNQALQHLDLQEPDREHKLRRIIAVEKQLQAAEKGVRHILILDVDFNNCSLGNIEGCIDTKTCEISILEKPGLNLPNDSKIQITSKCDPAPMPLSQQNSTKPLESDVNDPEILKLAAESLQRFDLASNNTNRLKIVKINSASTQVVSGFLTKISYDVALTKCPKGDTAVNVQSCELMENTPTQRCEAKIWTHPLLNGGKRIDVICNNANYIIKDAKKKTHKAKPHKAKTQIIGGPTIQNPEQFNAAVNESLQKLEQVSQSQYKQKVVKVTSVKTKVVNGFLTKIHFDVAFTKCFRNELTTGVESCELLEDWPVRQCHSEIRNRPWLKKDGKQITVTCHDDSTAAVPMPQFAPYKKHK